MFIIISTYQFPGVGVCQYSPDVDLLHFQVGGHHFVFNLHVCVVLQSHTGHMLYEKGKTMDP